MLEAIETLTYEECSEKVDFPLLGKQLKYIADCSDFYNEKWKAVGLATSDVLEMKNFGELPFTSKEDVLKEQADFPPFGRLANAPQMQENLRRVHVTSGSSGRSVFIAMTEKDVQSTLTAGIRAFRCAGLTPNDTVVHCLSYCMWAGGVTDHLSLEGVGAMVVPFGVGHSHKLIETIRRIKPTGISCTPSYLSRLELLLKEDFGITPKDLGLKKAFLGGEGGLQNPEIREKIRSTWGLEPMDANYGMSDVLSIFGSECEHQAGLHFHGQGIIHLELINPDSGIKLPVVAGQIGEMVLTNLTREAQPLLRYKTGDLIEVLSTSRCDCGRNSLRFKVVDRVDDMITVRGINVYPSSVGKILSDRHACFSGEYELVLTTPPPYERPVLRVEAGQTVTKDEFPGLMEMLTELCASELNFTPAVELLEYGMFPRSEGKTKRVRKAY
ncbi:phenylacetate--CoA ligase family protein [Geomonas oryzisoli]|uniref:phenylacetate--CoA ligase family protein n=1 Tax=Geomonas oryzisoli TaxID=2847992 RepID=UPI001EF01CE2|nr:AMP-binding protein [Geomonas oryzisoli]